MSTGASTATDGVPGCRFGANCQQDEHHPGHTSSCDLHNRYPLC
jgi:hypothetical protein